MVSRSFFGIEILHSLVQHLDRLLPGINLYVLFWASTSCKLEVKKISVPKRRSQKCRYPKKDISILTKRVTPLLRDDPKMTTTTFEFVSRCPIFYFWGTPACCINHLGVMILQMCAKKGPKPKLIKTGQKLVQSRSGG